MLDSIITSKTRLKLLLKFYVSATSKGHLRGLAEEFNESTNAIRRELNQLSEAGFLEKTAQQNKVVYNANKQHILFKPLQRLIHSFLGIENYIEQMLERAGDVQQVSIIGAFAKGLDSEDIEVLILGKRLNTDYLRALALKVESQLKKKIILYFDKPAGVESQIILYEEVQVGQ